MFLSRFTQFSTEKRPQENPSFDASSLQKIEKNPHLGRNKSILRIQDMKRAGSAGKGFKHFHQLTARNKALCDEVIALAKPAARNGPSDTA
jgi:hypothetical protein